MLVKNLLKLANYKTHIKIIDEGENVLYKHPYISTKISTFGMYEILEISHDKEYLVLKVRYNNIDNDNDITLQEITNLLKQDTECIIYQKNIIKQIKMTSQGQIVTTI